MTIINLKDKSLFFVGGIVRDEILGISSPDVDLTYEGNAIEFARNLPNIKILQENEVFGTVTIEYNGTQIDIASTRKESYPRKGHLPVVDAIACDLESDIIRRDFTVNTLAKNTLTNELIDFVGGLNDIKEKKLRILHENSFIDDPTRILRGLKFVVRLGFELEEKTKRLQDEYLSNVNLDMSYKRVKDELISALEINKQEVLIRLIEQSIYKLFDNNEYKIPNVNIEDLVKKYIPDCIWICYAGLFDLSKLPLSKVEKRIIEEVQDLENSIKPQNKFEIVKLYTNKRTESLILHAVKGNRDEVELYLDELSKIKVTLSGKDYIELGQMPSENFSKCNDFILKHKLNNPEMQKDEELELAKKFFCEYL